MHFYDFSMILYAFYKNQQKSNTIEDLVFHRGAWNFSRINNHVLGLQIEP
jgi:hypothetical protein